MHQSIYIALGGSVGALSRHYLATWVGTFGLSFPLGTLVVNVLGSFLIGILFEGSQKLSILPIISPFVFVGFLGSLTTFSAFSLQTIQLIRSGQINTAALYILCQVCFGLAASFVGMRIAEYFWS